MLVRNATSWLALSLLGFLSPGNGGIEGGVKTIEGWERLPLFFSKKVSAVRLG